MTVFLRRKRKCCSPKLNVYSEMTSDCLALIGVEAIKCLFSISEYARRVST